jgi:hypothetical protein
MLWLGVAVLLIHLTRARHPAHPLSRHRAAVWVVLAWAVPFGTATVRAIVYLTNTSTRAQFIDTGPQFLTGICLDYLPTCLFAALALVAVSQRVATTPGRAGLAWPSRDQRQLRELAGLTLLCLLVLLSSLELAQLLPTSDSPWDRQLTHGAHPWFILDTVFNSVAAAIGEELLVVVVPVLLMRAAKIRTRWIVLALLALRLTYHLYYGWASLNILLWASLFLTIYLVRGLIWPQLIAHFTLDTINGVLGPKGIIWQYKAAWFLAFALPLGYLLAARFRLRRARLAGFTNWVTSGGPARIQAAIAANSGPQVTVTAKKYVPPLTETRRRNDGTYQLQLGPGVQHMHPDELAALTARAAATIDLGHPYTRWQEQRADRLPSRLAPALLLIGALVALGIISPRFGPVPARWFAVVLAALMITWRHPLEAATAARIRARTIIADRAATAVNPPGMLALLKRLQELEEPAAKSLYGRGTSHRVPAERRIAELHSGAPFPTSPEPIATSR